jgi:hypothetical protein
VERSYGDRRLSGLIGSAPPITHREGIDAPQRFLDKYLDAAGIHDAGKPPRFRSAAGETGALTDLPMSRIDAYQTIRPAYG